MPKFLSWRHMVSLLACLAGLTTGCATLPGVQERYVACPYDTVWHAAVRTMEPYPVVVHSKEKGVIETDWVVTVAPGRPYGAFNRDQMENKERFRNVLTLDRVNTVTLVRLSETREYWGFRGGARIYQWYPLEPSQEALTKVMTGLTTRLEADGCTIDS